MLNLPPQPLQGGTIEHDDATALVREVLSGLRKLAGIPRRLLQFAFLIAAKLKLSPPI